MLNHNAKYKISTIIFFISFQSLEVNIVLGTWTHWANGTTDSIVLHQMRAKMYSVVGLKATNIVAPRKTKSFNRRFKSKYQNLF